MVRNVLFSALVALMLSPAALGQRERLAPGKEAPGLDIDTWIQGDEVTIQSGKTYLIEFWATWCKPCRKTIPHLNELYDIYHHDGLEVIGISSGEKKQTVESFVHHQGDNMQYNIALDRRASTKRSWMDAAGLKGIPAAFLVGPNGRIQWMGNPHPMADQEELDEILPKVLDGRYDVLLMKDAEPLLEAAKRHHDLKNWRMAFNYLDRVIELDNHIFAFEHFKKYEIMAVDMEDPQRADQYAQKLISDYSDDATFLKRFAKMIATSPKIPDNQRAMDTALKAAKAARKAFGSDDPKGLAIVALIHHHRGEHQQAVELQREAFFTAHPRWKDKYRRDLKKYQMKLESN